MEKLPDKSPHWPGIGRFIGYVNDIKYSVQTPLRDKFYFWDNYSWQERRVYSDEIPMKFKIIRKVN